MPLNDFQKVAANVYGDGDYAHITEPEHSEDVGDTLFTFVIRELGDDGAAMTLAEALSRLDSAAEELLQLRATMADALAKESV